MRGEAPRSVRARSRPWRPSWRRAAPQRPATAEGRDVPGVARAPPRRRRRPRCRRSSTACRRPSSPPARRTTSTTSCGSRSNADTDFDGKKDRVHVDVSRPTETDTDGLKVPVIYEDSPYYAGGADVANWAVDHEIGAPPLLASARRRLQLRQHQPDDQHDLREHLGAARLRRRALRVARHRQLRPAARTPARRSRRTAPPRSSTGSTAARRATRPAPARPRSRRTWHTGNVGMMGTSYNGTIPIAAASTGVEGLKAIVPISAISDWYDYYRANGMTRAPGGFQGEDLDVLTEYVYSRNDEGPHRTICWPTIDDVAANAGPRHRQPQRVLGRPQLHEGRRRRSRPRRSSPTATTTSTS